MGTASFNKSTELAPDRNPALTWSSDELPLTARQASIYLGVSMQTVYLWVERKQIPHLRVMGRNIRFLKSDLEPFRAHFNPSARISNRRWDMARPSKHDGNLYKRDGSKVWWMRYRGKDGIRHRESTLTENWAEAQKYLRERLQAKDNDTLPSLRRGQNLAFGEWADFYLENFSKPPFRAPKTHEINERVLKHLRTMFETTKLANLTADDIEHYLRQTGVEFPARVDGLFRPHYVTWSEQRKIEFSAPEYLRNVIRIVTETGLP
jgi:excisionase family DNA binding protein